MILGLIKPSDGEILIDSQKIEKNIRGWISIVGYVPQDTFIIDDTIQNNIIFDFDEKVDQERLRSAINKASLDKLVEKNGLNDNVGERGSKLSGGQKQRIGIARAIYKKSEIIVFDESTSSLDTETEKDIMSNIYKLKLDHTLIIISHRSSTLESCDKIFQIDNGKITQLK